MDKPVTAMKDDELYTMFYDLAKRLHDLQVALQETQSTCVAVEQELDRRRKASLTVRKGAR